MTTATLSQVHTSPLKPCAWAPWANSSGNLARCSSLRRDGAPGGGSCVSRLPPLPLWHASSTGLRLLHYPQGPRLSPTVSSLALSALRRVRAYLHASWWPSSIGLLHSGIRYSHVFRSLR